MHINRRIDAPVPTPEVNTHNVNDATLAEVTDSATTGVPPIGQPPLAVTEHDTDNLNKPKVKNPAHQQWGRMAVRCLQPR